MTRSMTPSQRSRTARATSFKGATTANALRISSSMSVPIVVPLALLRQAVAARSAGRPSRGARAPCGRRASSRRRRSAGACRRRLPPSPLVVAGDDEAGHDDLEFTPLAAGARCPARAQAIVTSRVPLGRESRGRGSRRQTSPHISVIASPTAARNIFGKPCGSRLRGEHRRHQLVGVEVAFGSRAWCRPASSPDRADARGHLPHAGRRVAPRHAEPLLDVRLDLASRGRG